MFPNKYQNDFSMLLFPDFLMLFEVLKIDFSFKYFANIKIHNFI